MKVIYIAGKYRGPNSWAVEQNIRAASNVAAKVWAAGHVALCPHTNSAHMEGVCSDEVVFAGTLELMRRCDAVLCVSNWRDSVESRGEVEEAKRRGLPVFGEDQARDGSDVDDLMTCMRVYFKAKHGDPGQPSDAYKFGIANPALSSSTGDEYDRWLRPLINDIVARVSPLIGQPYNDATIAAAEAEIDAAIAAHTHPKP